MANRKKTPKEPETKAEPAKVDDTTAADAGTEGKIDDTKDDLTGTVGKAADNAEDDTSASSDPVDADKADTVSADTDDDNSATENAAESEPPDGEEKAESDRVERMTIRPATVPEPVVIQKGGFVPTVLGGLVAGAIGFGIAMLTQPAPADLTDLQRKVDGQTGATTKLTDRVETLEAGRSTNALEAAQSDNASAIAGLADRLSGLEARLAEIENRPADDGTSGPGLAAFEQELKELQAAVDTMSENAALLEENAQAAAKATLQRAAMTRILTALDAGNEFQSPLADLDRLGVEVPAELQQAAAGGVPTLAALQESFPEAARAALGASRGVGEQDGGGFTSFLKTQLGARSLEPREGNDPDAILSRAEAATREGRLTDALAEIETLPEEGRAELSGWSARASRRLDAVAAAQALGEKLN